MNALIDFMEAGVWAMFDVVNRGGRRLSDERGQGTVEYVGLILLVGLLMVGIVVAMKGFNDDSS